MAARFGPPDGKALITWRDTEVIGCVAYKDGQDGTAEMKRLFVPDRGQGWVLGRRLAEAVVNLARADGFTSMKLDTGFLHEEAISMYASMGFRPCEPHIEYPPDLLPHVRLFERELWRVVGHMRTAPPERRIDRISLNLLRDCCART